MTTLIVSYALVSLLLAAALQSRLDDLQRQDGYQLIVAVLFCVLWPLIPVFMALMRWDIRRMERKRDYHSEHRSDREAP